MPIAPYTWQTNDFLTAIRLNGELRQTKGQPFLANGAGWHAQRPVYKTFLTAGTTQLNSAGWNKQAQTSSPGSWSPVIDTAAFLGGKGDLITEGVYFPRSLTNGGGASGSPAGLGLFWTYQPMITSASGGAKAGVGSVNNPSPGTVGTHHSYNGNAVTPWALTLTDTTSQLTGFYDAGSSTPAGYVTATGDGSGSPPRQMALWSSVYPANGTVVSSIPAPVTNWTGTSPSLSAALLNGPSGIAQAMNLLNMPPLMNVTAITGTSIPSGSTTSAVNYPAAAYDTYGGWSSATNTYTVQLPGLYLVCAFGGFEGAAGQSGAVNSGVTINGTAYNGPWSPMFSTAACKSSKVQIFSLNAGDQIQHVIQQTSGATITTSTTDFSNMTILWLGAKGAPATLPIQPDFTFLFAAGTPGSQMPGLLNAHLANDLQYLIQRPYTMAYQTSAQAAFANGTSTALQLQSNTGIVHGDSAASYGGWGGTTYIAPHSGWYLCTYEFFMAAPPNGTCWYTGTFSPSPGVASNDFYEIKNARNAAGGGASAVSLYYMRAGDSITPMGRWNGATGTLATQVSAGAYNSHFEAVWVSS